MALDYMISEKTCVISRECKKDWKKDWKKV
jgi:hypothetical protein